MKFGREIIVAILGAVVLVGCQQGDMSTVARTRWAGEFELVATSKGLASVTCLKDTAKQISTMSEKDMDKCMAKSLKRSVSAEDSKQSQVSKGRMFYSDTTYTSYLYLPYYYWDSNYSDKNYYNSNNYNSTYSDSSYSDTSELLYSILFGKKCTDKNWYSNLFGYQPQQQSHKYYNPPCRKWLTSGLQDYSDLSLGNLVYNPDNYGSWNNNYDGCYNVY